LDLPDYGSQENIVDDGALLASMNSRVIAVLVEPGQQVAKGDSLLVTEAMKMEHTIKAPRDGTIDVISCKVDDLVVGGEVLVSLVPA
jgi:3-methylcrotonyl-CoA carboxylase alpha subunit